MPPENGTWFALVYYYCHIYRDALACLKWEAFVCVLPLHLFHCSKIQHFHCCFIATTISLSLCTNMIMVAWSDCSFSQKSVFSHPQGAEEKRPDLLKLEECRKKPYRTDGVLTYSIGQSNHVIPQCQMCQQKLNFVWTSWFKLQQIQSNLSKLSSWKVVFCNFYSP